jgi:hypothetical protein
MQGEVFSREGTIYRCCRPSLGQSGRFLIERIHRNLLPCQVFAILTQETTPMLGSFPPRRLATAQAILSQGIEDDLTDRLAGLTREGTRQLGSLGIADMKLVFHSAFSEMRSSYKSTSAAFGAKFQR